LKPRESSAAVAGIRQSTTRSLAEALGVERGDLVSLVGGGGKTTLMYRLARELRALGLRAAAATTTKIRDPGRDGGLRLVRSASCEGLGRALSEVEPEVLPVAGRNLVSGGKVAGIPPEWCDRLLGEGLLDALVVEADGAAMKPVKAPEEWEPVVPQGTTVFVAVVGLSCLGRPAVPEEVFRLERFCSVTGTAPGELLAPQTLKRLLRSPEGLLKGARPGARTIAFLNQADLPGTADPAEELARGLLETPAPYHRVVVGALRDLDQVFEIWTQG